MKTKSRVQQSRVKVKREKRDSFVFQPRRIKVRIIGIGGGGVSIILEMAPLLRGASFIAADSDLKILQKAKRRVRTFQLGAKLVKGTGTGADSELAQKAAIDDKPQIAKLFQEQDIIILVSCLGGGVGSGATSIFAEAASGAGARSRPERGGKPSEGPQAQGSFGASRLRMPIAIGKPVTIGIFTLPFLFEGERKMNMAKKVIERISQNLSGTIVIPNERIFQFIDKRTPLKKSLSTLNQMFTKWLAEWLEIILRPGLINIDFADLRTILQGQGSRLFLGQAQASGPNRAEEILKTVFSHSLHEQIPKEVKRILFNITGGKDMGIKEIEAVSQSIFRLNPRAKIIFGVSQESRYNGKLKLCLLAVSEGGKKAKMLNNILVQQGSGSAKHLAGNLKARIKVKAGNLTKNNKKAVSILKPKRETVRQTALEVRAAQEAEIEKELSNNWQWEVPPVFKKHSE